MVKRIIAIFMLAIIASASDFVQYDPTSYPVTNRVVAYLPSLDTPAYIDKPGFMLVTNRAAQSDTGVYMTNLNQCVVDGTMVRLLSAPEQSLIASNNWWIGSNSVVVMKIEARQWASNVVNEADGLSLYLRSLAEANWFFLNQIRTNDGKPALSRATYKNTVDSYIDQYGQ